MAEINVYHNENKTLIVVSDNIAGRAEGVFTMTQIVIDQIESKTARDVLEEIKRAIR